MCKASNSALDMLRGGSDSMHLSILRASSCEATPSAISLALSTRPMGDAFTDGIA